MVKNLIVPWSLTKINMHFFGIPNHRNICPLQNQNSFWNHSAFLDKHRTFLAGLSKPFCWKFWKKYLNCESVCLKLWKYQNDSLNHLAFPNKHRILWRGLNKTTGLRSVKISDYQGFSARHISILQKVQYLQSTVSKNRLSHCRRYTSCWKNN